jgi:hypothetical protein
MLIGRPGHPMDNFKFLQFKQLLLQFKYLRDILEIFKGISDNF